MATEAQFIQSVLDFTNNWRKTKGIAGTAVLTDAQQILFARELQAVLAGASVVPIDDKGIRTFLPNANPIPYSGNIGDIPAWKFAEAASNSANGELFFISNTPAGRFMNDEEFKKSVIGVVGGADDVAGKAITSRILGGVWSADGSTRISPYGVGDVLSINDYFSKRMMTETAYGDIRPLVPASIFERVWGTTELPAALANTKIDSIWGVPRTELIGFRDALMKSGITESAALMKVHDLIAVGARIGIGAVDCAVDMTDPTKPKINWIDTAKLFNDPKLGTSLPEGMSKSGTLGQLAGAPSLVERLAFANLSNLPGVNYGQYLSTVNKVLSSTTLNTVGGLLMAGALIKTAFEAKELYDKGDIVGATKVAAGFIAGTAGGFLASRIIFAGSVELFAALSVLGPIGIGAGVVSIIATQLLAGYLGDQGGHWIVDQVYNAWSIAQKFLPRRDPFILDLDGDGVETVGLSAGVLFDHTGSGIKTGTGWVGKDDGLLVWDKNSNGKIDSGLELFGDSFVKANGTKAIDGFDALASLDSNSDKKITSADSAWSSLKVWVDANTNGITDAGELKTLSELNITAISTSKIGSNQTQANGNVLADAGSYTKSDGSNLGTGTAYESADINFVQDTFHRQFTDVIPIAADVKPLPSMKGTGHVRDLQEAASLNNTTGAAFKAALKSYVATTDSAVLRSGVDAVLLAWANTSDMIGKMQDRKPSTVKIKIKNNSLTKMQYAA